MKNVLLVGILSLIISGQIYAMNTEKNRSWSAENVSDFFSRIMGKQDTASHQNPKPTNQPEEVIFQYVKKQYPYAQESVLLRVDPQAKTITRQQPTNNWKLDKKSCAIGVAGATAVVSFITAACFGKIFMDTFSKR